MVARCEITAPATFGWNHQQMTAFALFVAIPMAIQQMGENESLDLCVRGFVELLLIAGLVRTFGIHIGNKENVLSIRRPDRSVGFGRNRSQLVSSSHRAGRDIKVRDPDLRTAFLG